MAELRPRITCTKIAWSVDMSCLRYTSRQRDRHTNPRWRPSVMLDLLSVCSDHPRRAFGGLYRCAKFGWNRYSSIDNTHVFYFASLAWKSLFTSRKLRFWGYDPWMGSHIKEAQKGTSVPESASFEPSSAKIRRRVWPVGEFPKKGHK